MGTDYILKCLECGKEIDNDELQLVCPIEHRPSFLRAIYKNKKLEVKDETLGFYKFSDWLPIKRMLKNSSAPVTYRSQKLAERIGIPNLYITFNGYFPEIGANMTTGSFKECEAYSVCARLPDDFSDVLVVASAGNTARAFAKVCSDNNINLLLVVPEKNIEALWFAEELNPCVKLLCAGADSDYSDAIYLSELVCKIKGFVAEGGANNVARRDGMGTTVLSAVTTIGQIPDYYFQAVGSGTGAIAAWEANLRFIESKDYGNKKMKLILSQNDPFLLLKQSWETRKRELFKIDEREAKAQIFTINAKVLSNRNPPYGIVGGLYDALWDTDGIILGATNDEARLAGIWFKEAEKIDISPAASVALASLIQSVQSELIDTDKIIMLNITGGGIERFKTEHKIIYLKPAKVINREDFSIDKIKKAIEKLF
jgi:cysteate synthase